jgi:hypothetical protein
MKAITGRIPPNKTRVAFTAQKSQPISGDGLSPDSSLLFSAPVILTTLPHDFLLPFQVILLSSPTIQSLDNKNSTIGHILKRLPQPFSPSITPPHHASAAALIRDAWSAGTNNIGSYYVIIALI